MAYIHIYFDCMGIISGVFTLGDEMSKEFPPRMFFEVGGAYYLSTDEHKAILKEQRALVWEEAAALILKYPNCTQDTMVTNFLNKAKAERGGE